VTCLTQAYRLSKTRRKRAAPDDWATTENVQSYKPIEKSKSLYPGAESLSTDASGDLVLLGGDNGVAGIYSASENEIVQEMEVGSGAVTDAVWAGTRAVVSTSSGVIKVFEGQTEVASFSGHAGKVTALAMHPSGDLLASVGVDKSYILYDLTSYKQATQVYTDAGKAKTGYISTWSLTLHQISHAPASIQTVTYSQQVVRMARSRSLT